MDRKGNIKLSVELFLWYFSLLFICPHYKIEKKCFEFKPKNINISIKDLSIYAKQKFESELKVEKVVNLSLSFRKVSEVR